MVKQAKHFCGTYFIEDFKEEDFVKFAEQAGAKYCIGQIEECPNTAKKHLQFYIRFRVNRRFSWLKKNLPRTIHWEVAKGNFDQNYEYCSKLESRIDGPFEYGDRPAQGSRKDLVRLQESLDGGKSIQEISKEHFPQFLKYRNSISAYVLLHQPPRMWEMENYIFWGKTGSGKTRAVYDTSEINGDTVYPLSQNANGTVWFDGYGGDDVVLIDDFYGWIKISYMLKLMDRYPMMVQVKGSALPFISKKIIITSNKPPNEWYQWNNQEIYAAFKRRINGCFYFDKDGKQHENMWTHEQVEQNPFINKS